MRFSYGGFTEEDGAVNFDQPRYQIERGDDGVVKEYTITWNLQGEIVVPEGTADPEAYITAQIEARKRAYNQDYGDAIFYDSAGRRTAHYLLSAQAIGGVLSSGMGFPTSDGGEYITGRVWNLTLTARFGAWFGAANPNQTVEYNEQVTIVGTGGPRRIVTETLNTKPVVEIVKNFTICRATQTGSCTKIGAKPVAPPPIWPQWVIEPEKAVTENSPREIGTGPLKKYEFTVSWNYRFESPVPLRGTPSPRIK